MSFHSSAVYAKSLAESRPSIALVTGGKSGIGKAIALKIATFPFIEQVLAVSRSITDQDVAESPKVQAFAADVGTPEGRQLIVDHVRKLCISESSTPKQLRYLIHNAGTIDPIKSVLEVQPQEFRTAMSVNCESPFFLTTALYPFLCRLDDQGIPGRVLHVSSGAAHGAPPVGWSVYGITKAAFFQSYKVLEREFREQQGGRVIVGSFKPGVVDTSMQDSIRKSSTANMPFVQAFQSMKDKAAALVSSNNRPRPPPQGALDSPENVAYFAEFLLLGTSDEEFANPNASDEFDIRDEQLYSRWIARKDME
jgi:benzil reductase ((S)-benzoin forming)